MRRPLVFERLSLSRYLKGHILGMKIFYRYESTFLWLLRNFGVVKISNALIPAFGMVSDSSGIREAAYYQAKTRIRKQRPLYQVLESSEARVDWNLIGEKWHFQTSYESAEFLLLTRQILLEAGFLDRTSQPPKPKRSLWSNISRAWDYLVSFLAIPVSIFFFLKKHANFQKPTFNRAIICEVDCVKTVAMFKNIFENERPIQLYAAPIYADAFQGINLDKINIHCFSRQDRRWVWSQIRCFLWKMILYMPKSHAYGIEAFEYMRTIVNGCLLTPTAENCLFLTFEHLSTRKAVRNELIRATNNVSFFVPFNVYAIGHYFAPEYRYNYDVLCSPGPMLEEAYSFQHAKTHQIIKAGPYFTHLALQRVSASGSDPKVTQIKTLSHGKTVLTILCNGISDSTLSGENKLMDLVHSLAHLEDVFIAVRRKPVEPPAKYRSFYQDKIRHLNNVILTDNAIPLESFLGFSDLFITGSSSSAIDLCSAGATFFSIDFWNDQNLFKWQTAVDGIFLEESAAVQIISDWCLDIPGKGRPEHFRRMQKLRNLAAYRFDDFAKYKTNLVREILKYEK